MGAASDATSEIETAADAGDEGVALGLRDHSANIAVDTCALAVPSRAKRGAAFCGGDACAAMPRGGGGCMFPIVGDGEERGRGWGGV